MGGIAVMLRRWLVVGIAVLLVPFALRPALGQSDSGIQVYQNVLKSTVWIRSDRGNAVATGSGSLIDPAAMP